MPNRFHVMLAGAASLEIGDLRSRLGSTGSALLYCSGAQTPARIGGIASRVVIAEGLHGSRMAWAVVQRGWYQSISSGQPKWS
jgi:hypothetical protein